MVKTVRGKFKLILTLVIILGVLFVLTLPASAYTDGTTSINSSTPLLTEASTEVMTRYDVVLYYKFVPTENANYTISTSNIQYGATTYCWLYDSVDHCVAEGDSITWGLTANQTYYIGILNYEYPYATCMLNTTGGAIQGSYTAPTVTTDNITTYTATTATMGGNVTDQGSAAVTERGYVYSSTDATPTVGEAGVTKVADGSGTGAFSESISSLSASTTYYICAYATNNSGTSYAYGAVKSFTTPDVYYTTLPGTNYTMYAWDFFGGSPASNYFGFTTPSSGFSLKDYSGYDIGYCSEAGYVMDSSIVSKLTFNSSTAGDYYIVATCYESDITTPKDSATAMIHVAAATPPTVTTDNVTTYTATTATMGGNVTDQGSAAVTERGVVYSSSDATPTVGEAGVTKVVDGSGTGIFSESVSSLSASTTYYVCAYATNNSGTSYAYGSVKSFSTLSSCTSPTVMATGGTPTFLQGSGSGVDLFSSVTAATNDSGQTFSGATLTVTNVADTTEYLTIGGTDVALTNGNSGSIATGGNYSVSMSGSTVTVTLSGMTLADAAMSTLIDGITYKNTDASVTAGSRVVTLTSATDSGSSNNSATLSIAATVTVTDTYLVTGNGTTFNVNGSGGYASLAAALAVCTGSNPKIQFGNSAADPLIVNAISTDTYANNSLISATYSGYVYFSNLADRTVGLAIPNGVTATFDGLVADNPSSAVSFFYSIYITGTGNLNITGSTNITHHNSSGSGVCVIGTGTLSMDGGSISTDGIQAKGIDNYYGTVNVSGGTVSASGTEYVAAAIQNYNSLTVSGTALVFGVYAGVYLTSAGTLNISGGTIEASGVSRHGVYCDGSGAITMTGGTVRATNTASASNYNYAMMLSANNVTISGGEVYGAGQNSSSGAINVSGGAATLTVSGTANIIGAYNGIYSSSTRTADYGAVYINGGTVSGIVALSSTATGLMTINDGTVIGTNAALRNATTGTVNITGGLITGSGYSTITCPSGGTINITNGIIENTSSSGFTISLGAYEAGLSTVINVSGTAVITSVYTRTINLPSPSNHGITEKINLFGKTVYGDVASVSTFITGALVSGKYQIDSSNYCTATVRGTVPTYNYTFLGWTSDVNRTTSIGDANGTTISALTTGGNTDIYINTVPSQLVSSGYFTDSDNDKTQISGTISWTAANPKDYITGYKIYWGSNATTKLTGYADPLYSYTIKGDGTDTNSQTVAADTAVPDGAKYFLIYSYNICGNSSGCHAIEIVDLPLDTTPPTVSSVSVPSNGTYAAGRNLDFTVNLDEAANVVTTGGTPYLTLTIGSSTVHAAYLNGTGTTALTFRYTVAAGDNDTDGIIIGALVLNGATIKDAVGNDAMLTLNSVGSTTGVKVDTTAPTTTIAACAFSADTGVSSTDFITKTAAQTICGTLSANLAPDEYVEVSCDNGTTWATATATVGQNTWSLAGQTLTGSNTLKVRVTDTAGNIGTTFSRAYVYETSAPTTTITAWAFSADTGVSSKDFITKTAAQTIYGNLSANLAAGEYVEVSFDNGATWATAIATVGQDTWSLAGQTLTGSNTLKFRVTDTAGNIGTTSSQAYVYDTTAPTTTITAWAFSADTGVSSMDFITNTAAQTIRGNLSANLAAGEYVEVSCDNGATLTTATATVGQNTWSLAGQTLTGNNTLKVRVTDTAGNIGTTSSQAYVYDTTSPTISSVSAPANDTYVGGENLDFTATVSENVTVSGTPYLTLSIGSTTCNAAYVSGSGTTAIKFRYTVAEGDYDANGILVSSPVILNGGTITDTAGNNATLVFTPPVTTAVLVDGVAPTVSGVTGPSAGTYKIGDELYFTATTSENVTVSGTGTPYIALTIGSTTRQAVYVSGSGTTTLKFLYTVAAGDYDADGILASSPIILNAGTIKDAAGNDATLTFTPPTTTAVLVDGIAPTVSGVTGPSAYTYQVGDELYFTATVSEPVTISGTPYIALTIGSTTCNAVYVSGSGSTTLKFLYTVAEGDYDADGILSSSPVILNGCTIIDAAGNDATLTFTPPTTTSVLVDGVAPTVSGVSGPAAGTYITDDQLNFTVNFSENVTVSGTGTPYIALTIGSTTCNAAYVSGSGSTTLKFLYTIAEGDYDADGILVSSPVILNGGTITDAAGNNATLTFTPLTTTSVLVDGVAPTVSSVSVPASKSYKAGDNLDFIVNFDEAVVVTGTPRIAFVVGSSTVYATYVSGSNTTALTFRYTVAAGDTDSDGIAVGALSLNGGTIKDSALNDAVLTLNSVGSTAAVLVDTVAPMISSVGVPANKTYKAGGNLDFTVDFAENVDVVTTGGTPTIALTIGSSTVNASYANGTGTTALTFRYTVAAGDSDADGIGVGSVITLNGGTIKDAAGNDATLTLNSVGSTTAVLIDGIAPTIGTAVPADNYDYVDLSFSEGVYGAADGTTALAAAELTLVFNQNGGDATGVTIDSVKKTDGTVLTGGETTVRVYINITGIPKGVETVAIKAADGVSVFDAVGNPLAADQISTVITLRDLVSPTAGGSGTVTVTKRDYRKTDLSWTAATDNATAQADLLYKVVYSTTDNIATIDSAEANGVIAQDWTANLTSVTATNLYPGTTYYFNVIVKDAFGNKTVYIPLSVKTFVTPEAPTVPPTQPTNVLVNGQSQTAGTAETTTNSNGQTVTTVTLDTDELNDILEGEDNGATVTISVGNTDVASGVLTGQMVDNMEENDVTLEIRTDNATYSLPAEQIDINAVSASFGADVSLADITVNISIAEPSDATATVVSNAADEGGFTLVVPAVDYSITCSYNGQTTTVTSFDSFVKRTVAIPAGVDPAKITTGVVVDPDGTVHHVPTKIIVIDGVYYAQINSLTNSTYTVIYNPVEFTDVASHWAKNAVNDMGSRLVVTGVDGKNYQPDRDITRAEFATIMVRALGLGAGVGDNGFSDVKSSDWYCGYIETAVSYGLITGYSDGSFRPGDKITREQAMTIIARAMEITKLESALTDSEQDQLLAGYTDAWVAADYALTGIAACIDTGVVNGRTATTICPQDNITRAEVAAIVQRLLQKSGLI